MIPSSLCRTTSGFIISPVVADINDVDCTVEGDVVGSAAVKMLIAFFAIGQRQR
jgi:hypothetical protein